MEVTLHLDGDPTAGEEGFFESKVTDLQHTIKALQFDTAELVKANDELAEKVKTLATRQPMWPKGYRPQFKKRR